MKTYTAFFIAILFFMVKTGIAQTLNVATYNIRQQNESDIGNMWEDRKSKVSDLIRFHEFDVFGIQEAFNNQINDLSTALPEYDYVGVGRDDGKEKGEYSAIFYNKKRFKNIKNGTFWLNEKDINTPLKGWDAALPRICTWAIFEDKLNGKKFIIMNTHFDHVGKEARKESAKLLLQKAKEFANNLPLIITGDLNIDEHNEAYFTLSKSNIVRDTYDLAAIKYEPNSSFNNWGKSIKEKRRIDHIFVSNNFEVLKFGILTDTYMGKFPSDHFPVFTKLKWK